MAKDPIQVISINNSMRFFLIGLVLVSIFACKETATNNFPRETCSSLKEQNETLVVQNFYYEEFADNRFLAISEIKNIGEKKEFADFQVSPAWPKQDSALWSLAFKASSYNLLNNFLIAESEEDQKGTSYEMYNLDNGNKVLAYTYDKFEVLFSSEEERRFIAFYSREAANFVSNPFDGKENSLGILAYVNQNGEGQKYRIDVQTTANDYDISSPVIELQAIKENAIELLSGKTLYFTGEDGSNKNAINFNLKVSFFTKSDYEERSFLLQVRNDVLLPNAEINTDLEFKLVGLDG